MANLLSKNVFTKQLLVLLSGFALGVPLIAAPIGGGAGLVWHHSLSKPFSPVTAAVGMAVIICVPALLAGLAGALVASVEQYKLGRFRPITPVVLGFAIGLIATYRISEPSLTSPLIGDILIFVGLSAGVLISLSIVSSCLHRFLMRQSNLNP